ncbi:MAG: hypothetical protein AAFV25_16840, partial [Bacteroidota bacterium]
MIDFEKLFLQHSSRTKNHGLGNSTDVRIISHTYPYPQAGKAVSAREFCHTGFTRGRKATQVGYAQGALW